jgi:hypothetical protein
MALKYCIQRVCVQNIASKRLIAAIGKPQPMAGAFSISTSSLTTSNYPIRQLYLTCFVGVRWFEGLTREFAGEIAKLFCKWWKQLQLQVVEFLTLSAPGSQSSA